MKYLLDTNILSETRRSQPNRDVQEWIAAAKPEQLCLSVITIGEIGRGVTRLRERGDLRQAAAIQNWLDNIIGAFSTRIVPINVAVALRWATQSTAQLLPTADGLIAASATVHDLTLVTRNVKDFQRSGVRMLNPFTDS